MLIDWGIQLAKGCEFMILDFIFKVFPVNGHNMHGKVKWKIKEIKKPIQTNMLKKDWGLTMRDNVEYYWKCNKWYPISIGQYSIKLRINGYSYNNVVGNNGKKF